MIMHYYIQRCGFLFYSWRLLLGTIQLKPDNASAAAFACCVLHNICSVMRPKQYMRISADQADPDASFMEWRDLDTLGNLQASRGHRDRNEARHVRDHLRSYYNSIGAVDWQERAVLGHVSNTLCILLPKKTCINFLSINLALEILLLICLWIEH